MTENEAIAVRFIENIKNHAMVTLDHIAKEEPNISPLVYKGREKKADTILAMVEELQQYRALEKRLAEMFGDQLSLETVVDEMELVLKEPDNPHPVNAKILTYEDAKVWEEYKAIGTPEECQKSVKICKSMIERNITPEDMEEYMKFEDECISEGFTLKSLLEAGEKQKAKRPDYEGDGYSDGHLVYDTWICPCCGKHYEVDYDDYDFCPTCGQCIDWSDEE